MNFGERFKSHAKTLAEAATQFQNFDEMAEQDDYIHHDDLNVKSTTVTSDTPTRRTSELLDSLISPISINPSQETAEPHRRPSLTSSERSDQQQQESHYDDEGDSHDPILDNMRSKSSLKKKSSDLMSPPPEQERKTAANRFMDDLNDRLSKPLDIEQGLSQQTAAAASSTNSSVDTNNRWGWMKGVATSRMNDLMGRSSANDGEVPFRSPLSRTTSSVVPQKKGEFNVLQSSAILGEEDQAELDRIRLGAQGDSLTFILNMVKQHPQFAFIAFTLVLGSAMYFYSRQKGAEDDVN